MTDQHEKILSPLLNDAISTDLRPSTASTPKHGSQVHGTHSASGLALTLSRMAHKQQP
jgi:hypothetical protein